MLAFEKNAQHDYRLNFLLDSAKTKLFLGVLAR